MTDWETRRDEAAEKHFSNDGPGYLGMSIWAEASDWARQEIIREANEILVEALEFYSMDAFQDGTGKAGTGWTAIEALEAWEKVTK